jgi:hypothetical protein
MSNKRIRRPNEGLVEPEHIGPGEQFIDETRDVEGHSWASPAPPVDFSPRMPTHGGEAVPTEENDEA